ncbi:hypothetical protein JR316_0011958 [Psilocybe cubensis]|uniref:Uncharacterized protein n=2 Tax=Psilocybe cubensis TaxID=181762 RepID=A0ACB8GLG6_PSICU|nr:hypothetical protein JR316_0011958 [Psilocybe cubensis]KAH9476383.1 hypothetical protein JR316_0011958 [Psilocybe cubensis]
MYNWIIHLKDFGPDRSQPISNDAMFRVNNFSMDYFADAFPLPNQQRGVRYFDWQAWSSFVISAMTEAILIAAPGGFACIPLKSTHNFYVFWIPILCFEALLCALADGRGVYVSRTSAVAVAVAGGAGASSGNAVARDQAAREGLGLPSLRRRGGDLVQVLYRGSVVYFASIAMTYMAPIIFWVALPQGLSEVPLGFCVALPSVLSARLILGIRRTAAAKDRLGWSLGTGVGDLTTFEVRRDLTAFDVQVHVHRVGSGCTGIGVGAGEEHMHTVYA